PGRPVISAVTFMSGTRHEDTHVEYILDTETWLGPFGETPYELVEEVAALIVESELKARALRDLRPAQGSQLIFHATVHARRAARLAPRRPSRGGGGAGRPGHFRLRRRGGGQGGRGRGGRRAGGGPGGDERPRDTAREPPLPVDARGRRGAATHGDRAHHRRA